MCTLNAFKTNKLYNVTTFSLFTNKYNLPLTLCLSFEYFREAEKDTGLLFTETGGHEPRLRAKVV